MTTFPFPCVSCRLHLSSQNNRGERQRCIIIGTRKQTAATTFLVFNLPRFQHHRTKMKCTTFPSATYCCEQYLKYYYANRPTQNTYHRLRRHRHPSWTCACANCAWTRASSRCAWPTAWPSSCRPSWRRPSCARNVSSAPWFKRLGTTGATQLLRTRERGGAVAIERSFYVTKLATTAQTDAPRMQ